MFLHPNDESSTGYNGIDMYVVRKVISHIAKPLTYTCGTIFETGIFPDNMKVAKVIPVYKTGENNSFSNYRRISLLPQFSRNFETL